MKKLFSRFVTLFGLGSLFATQANSAIVYSNLEIVLTNDSIWDIDADGTSEGIFAGNGTSARFAGANVDFVAASTSRRLLFPSISTAFTVQETLANYVWNSNGTVTIRSSSFGYFIPGNTNNTSQYIGFRFDGNRNGVGSLGKTKPLWLGENYP